jgi:hypothetical protein
MVKSRMIILEGCVIIMGETCSQNSDGETLEERDDRKGLRVDGG